MMLDAPDAELLEEIRGAWENLVRERDHWQEVATLRERTIEQLLEERDEARYWATRLHQVAEQSREAILDARRRGFTTPPLRAACDTLDKALTGKE